MSEIRVTRREFSSGITETYIAQYAQRVMHDALEDGLKHFKNINALCVSLPQRSDVREHDWMVPESKNKYARHIYVSVTPVRTSFSDKLIPQELPNQMQIHYEVMTFATKHGRLPNVYFVHRPTKDGEKIVLSGFYLPPLAVPLTVKNKFDFSDAETVELAIITGTIEGPALI